jgi:predicted DNA-binding protein
MSMLRERLQVLVSEEQRQRLETEAARRGTSVATVVREAIDSFIGIPTQEERLAAVSAISEMRGVYLTTDELEAVIADERLRATGPG